MPKHPDPQGKSTNTVGTALGQPQDAVTGSTWTQSGWAQAAQMLLVRVTVGQPVCEVEGEEGVVWQFTVTLIS